MKFTNFPLNITEPCLLETEKPVLWKWRIHVNSLLTGMLILPFNQITLDLRFHRNYMSARVRCAQRWHILANIRRAGSSRRSTRAIALMTKKSSKGLMVHTKPVFSTNDSDYFLWIRIDDSSANLIVLKVLELVEISPTETLMGVMSPTHHSASTSLDWWLAKGHILGILKINGARSTSKCIHGFFYFVATALFHLFDCKFGSSPTQKQWKV